MPPKLLNQLEDILQRVTYFNTNNELRALFVDSRISAWKNQLPQADNVDSRIKRTIEYLYNNDNERGENALVLFLMVLSENIDTGDYLHGKVEELAEQINHHLTTSSPISKANWSQHIPSLLFILINGILVGTCSGGIFAIINIPLRNCLQAIIIGTILGGTLGWLLNLGFTLIEISFPSIKNIISYGILEDIFFYNIYKKPILSKSIIGAIHGLLVGSVVICIYVLVKIPYPAIYVPWLGFLVGIILGTVVSIGIIIAIITKSIIQKVAI